VITYDEIRAKADEFGIHTSNVQRDYVFGWLIAAVSGHSRLGDLLVLKGGNAFRKGYFPATRFSDDLDFSTASDLSGFDIVRAFNEVCEAAGAASGVRFDLDRNRLVDEQQLDRERRVLKLRLYFEDFTGTTQDLILKVRVDVTDLERLYLPVQTRRLIHPYSDWDACNLPIRCVKLEEALADKLRALMQRQYSHDLFDLVYAIFVSDELAVNRIEVVRTFLQKSVFQRDPHTPRRLLLSLPFDVMRGFWDKLVLPKLTRLSFDDAVARFTAGLAELFAPFATPERTAVGYFPAEFRADILRAGGERTLLRVTYGGIPRLVEPYSLVFKRRRDGLIKEYFYAWDRVGGSSGPGIKAFWPERVQSIEPTDERFEPRYPIELTKEGASEGGMLARPFSTRPRAARRSSGRRPRTAASDYPYRLRCSFCGKTFRRRTMGSTRLNSHADGYGNRCPGRHGYWS
jgi:predicted nucleotidyltransferase component of viral defense system